MRSEMERIRKAPKGLISTIILVLAVMLCLVVLVQVMTTGYVTFFGYSVFRVVTGSMEPTLPVGTLLVCHSERIDQMQVGDIVCFRSRESGRLGMVVTHRVRTVLPGSDGTVYLETKGDANLSPDGYYVTQDNLIGRVTWHSGEGNPLQGAISFITGKVGFLACIVFPILLLSGLILRDNVKSIKKDIQQAMDELIQAEETEKTAVPDQSLFTPEEYREMYERIRAEVMEELKQSEANQVSVSEEERNE